MNTFNICTFVSWLVVLGLMPFETVFQSISDRFLEKREKIDELKMSNQPHPHLLQAQ